ncbi:response regulator [Paenibacillus tepidiphilus]|uniref:response regulator n=1 Tax=Paenibacillus tepidiphilus TaxID=2608683 RepID=UPI0013A597B0|nr:response regulator [Paenibacillus tepidiphilus]
MYTVLLVDDDPLDLKGLERLVDWKGLGLAVIASAGGANEALEVLRSEAVDILMTDIRMPGISGIELARRAAEYSPGLKVVFISSQEDFSYARQAIALNASGYVMKPVNGSELYHTLTGVRQQLDRERASARLERDYAEMQPLLRRELLSRLLVDSRDASPMLSLLARSGLIWPAARLYTGLLGPDGMQRKRACPGQEALLHKGLQLEAAVEQFSAEEQILFCRVDPLHYALILEEDYERGRLGRLIKLAAEQANIAVTIGYGPIVANPGELYRSFQGAKEALKLATDEEDTGRHAPFRGSHGMNLRLKRRRSEVPEQQRKRQGKKRKLIAEMKTYIDEHLADRLLLRDAAEHFSFSPNHLGRIFYEETGIYFSDYVHLRRLERVKTLLADPKLKIYEAAERAGYKNLSHFSKQFKAHFGVSPGDYRRYL